MEYKTLLLEISFNLLWNRTGKNMSGLGSGSGASCAAQGGVGHVNELFSEPPCSWVHWLLSSCSGCWVSELWALGSLSAEMCPWWAAAWVWVTSQHLKLAGFVAYHSWFSLSLSVCLASLFLQEHRLNLCVPKESMKLQIHSLTFAWPPALIFYLFALMAEPMLPWECFWRLLSGADVLLSFPAACPNSGVSLTQRCQPGPSSHLTLSAKAPQPPLPVLHITSCPIIYLFFYLFIGLANLLFYLFIGLVWHVKQGNESWTSC